MPYSTDFWLGESETKSVSMPVKLPPLSETLALLAVMLALAAVVLALIGIPFRSILHDVLEIVRTLIPK